MFLEEDCVVSGGRLCSFKKKTVVLGGRLSIQEEHCFSRKTVMFLEEDCVVSRGRLRFWEEDCHSRGALF